MAGDREKDAREKEAGAARRRLAQGGKADALQLALESLDPDLGAWADEFVFGRVWAGEALGQRDRALVAIAMLAATSRRDQLKNYLHGALQSGISAPELREVMKMVTVYAGFPAAIEAMLEFDAVVAAHLRAAR